MNDLDTLLAAPNVSPEFKRHLTTPSPFLTVRHDKAQRRRLLDQPESITGFGEFVELAGEFGERERA